MFLIRKMELKSEGPEVHAKSTVAFIVSARNDRQFGVHPFPSQTLLQVLCLVRQYRKTRYLELCRIANLSIQQSDVQGYNPLDLSAAGCGTRRGLILPLGPRQLHSCVFQPGNLASHLKYSWQTSQSLSTQMKLIVAAKSEPQISN